MRDRKTNRRSPALVATSLVLLISGCLSITTDQSPETGDKAPVEIIVHQLAAYQDSIDTTIDIHLKWFAFACTINATVIGLIFAERLRLRTLIIPVVLVIGNCSGAVATVFVIRHYRHCHSQISSLLRQYPQQLTPTTPLGLLTFAGISVIVVCILMVAGWVYVVWKWDRYSVGRDAATLPPAERLANGS